MVHSEHALGIRRGRGRWGGRLAGRLQYDLGMSPFASTSIDGLLEAIRAELSTLSAMGVVRIGIFGSRATGAARPDSDVDVLVELEPHRDLLDLIAIRQHLESMLGLSVDITTPSGLRPDSREAIIRDLRYAA